MAAAFRNGPAYPPATRGKLVVWGLLGSFPFGGMTWQVIHHLVGLRRLGFDVWYVEEPDGYVFDTVTYDLAQDFTPNIRHIDRVLSWVGLGDRWVFRPSTDGEVYSNGGIRDLQDLFRSADAALNVCGAQRPRPDHDAIGCLIHLQTDPVAPQIKIARDDEVTIAKLDAHDHLFTYATNLGGPDCAVPVERYEWNVTLPPVCVDLWQAPMVESGALTTVCNWHHKDNDVTWADITYRWTKRDEFLNLRNLPSRSPLPLELAAGAIDDEDRNTMIAHGWRMVPSATLADPFDYRDYIRASMGEFSVVKEQYHRSRSGWFSDRSVCYLAAGRPVIIQDTGFGAVLPVGEGLLAFTNEDEALAAIEDVAADPDRHSKAALDIARAHLEPEVVLGDVLEKVGLL